MPMPRSIAVLENDFDAESTDTDASIARGARKRLKIERLNVPCLILSSLLPFFLPIFLPPSLTTFRKDNIKCAPITRENLVR